MFSLHVQSKNVVLLIYVLEKHQQNQLSSLSLRHTHTELVSIMKITDLKDQVVHMRLFRDSKDDYFFKNNVYVLDSLNKVFVFFKSVHGISLGVIILNIVAYGKRTICAAFLGSENDLSTGIAKYCHSKFLTSFFRDFYRRTESRCSGDLPAEMNCHISLCFPCSCISIQIYSSGYI